ncbi:MAG: pilus assembly protein TapA [Gammaproteobacteria bacterium]|jgi:type IV pilus assembly protein PilA|nr:pilus assembly protein TapA [Gammaproteobacteria bacterium]
MHQKLYGYTLLELMITLAILGILAALAIPNYQTYIKKAKFSEVIRQIEPYRTAVEVCAQLHDETGNFNSNCSTPGQNQIPLDYVAPTNAKTYVGSISTSEQAGEVVITAISQGLDQNYSYILRTESLTNGGFNWVVDSSSTCIAAGLCRT